MSGATATVYNPYAMEKFHRHFILSGHVTNYYDDVRTLPAKAKMIHGVFVKSEKQGRPVQAA